MDAQNLKNTYLSPRLSSGELDIYKPPPPELQESEQARQTAKRAPSAESTTPSHSPCTRHHDHHHTSPKPWKPVSAWTTTTPSAARATVRPSRTSIAGPLIRTAAEGTLATAPSSSRTLSTMLDDQDMVMYDVDSEKYAEKHACSWWRKYIEGGYRLDACPPPLPLIFADIAAAANGVMAGERNGPDRTDGI